MWKYYEWFLEVLWLSRKSFICVIYRRRWQTKLGEDKRRNEFAEWHVAWLAERHNYAECNICRMTGRNKLNWKLRPFLGPINSQAAAFLIGNLRTTTTTRSTTTGSELQCTAQARPVNFVVVVSIVEDAKQSRITSSCNPQASAGINTLF